MQLDLTRYRTPRPGSDHRQSSWLTSVETDIIEFKGQNPGFDRSPGPVLLETLELARTNETAYSAHREHGFQAIVNAVGGSAAEVADIGSSVHDEIDNGRIPAMTCSDSPLISRFLVSTPPALTAASRVIP